ncbi:MAG: transposase [Alloprevotella sp.]|nr:transposase [Alloprevotella sp.]
MKREVYERQYAFAVRQERKPTMLRRCLDHNYASRQIYMLTMVTEGRRPLLATLSGTSAQPDLRLTELGKAVRDEWFGIPRYYPQIEIIDLCVMPDHLHGILFVREKMEKDLSRVVRGFKTGCNRAFRKLVPSVATESQQTRHKDSHPRHGLLFAPGFNDKIRWREGQLARWRQYLADNPRRLLMKREHPDLFRVQRNLEAGGHIFSAIGNRFLLDRPERLQVQCSRSLTEEQIKELRLRFLAAARAGAVLVSPAISPGEKAIMNAAFAEGLPIIRLQENGFTDLAKPGGQLFEACAEGRLLILAPWEQHNEHRTITRGQCLTLNELSALICK